ncbi:MAG TPA: ATP-grasp domain-containing protein [Trebonia sp.]|jgi:predicted ATP-grasp superfamily ATP-dependent carboligase|nr:ATP-grasp domain-containing protein [Trebonia sp.]
MTGKPAVARRARNGDARGRGGYDVLVLDASMKQSLASVRSLGKAGLRVAAGDSVAQFNSGLPLPTFQSRYCQHTVVLPDLISDEPAFVAAITEFVRDHAPRVVLPTGDVTIGVLRKYRDQLAELGAVLTLSSESALEVANDKDRTLTLAEQLGILQPKSLRITDGDGLAAAAREFGFPFVIKPTISWTGGTVDRLVPVDVIDEAEARKVTEQILKAGAGVLAQQWVPGRREGVTLFIVGGEVKAACGHVAHRTTPPLGGASAVRESIQSPADTLDAAVRLAKAIDLEGVCEVEFRRDAENRPLLMEINARLAGTIENAVQAGVDFPLMIWRSATGQEVTPVTSHRSGVRTRWLHGDMRWLWQNWSRVGRPDGTTHARSVYIFVSEFAKSYHYDFFDRRDPKPFLAELRYTMNALRK